LRSTVIGVGELVTSGQAAKALGVSLRSLQQWVREGKIVPDYYATPGGRAR
jgi:predicted site-specific integrase-resolvase